MRISPEGNDMYICQLCGRDRDGVKFPSVWRTDLPTPISSVVRTRAGNVCPACMVKIKPKVLLLDDANQLKTQVKRVLESWEQASKSKADFLEKVLPYLDWHAYESESALQDRLLSIGKLCSEYAAETTQKVKGV